MNAARLFFWCALVFPVLMCGLVFNGGSYTSAATIKKCKDAQGRWHYGDIAAEECQRSKITEINDKGLKVRERGLPPTREELDAKRAEGDRVIEDKKRAKEQRRLDNRLLSTYENEQSIIDARDRRMESIDKIVKSNEKFAEALNGTLADLIKQSQAKTITEKRAEKLTPQITSIREQLAEYDLATEAKLKERTEVEERYNNERLRYLEILEGRAKLRASSPGS